MIFRDFWWLQRLYNIRDCTYVYFLHHGDKRSAARDERIRRLGHNEGEGTTHIQTYNAGLRKRQAAVSKKHPDLYRLEKSFAQGGVIYVRYKSRLSIRLQAPYSEERRQKASESAKRTGVKSQTE